MAENRRAWEPPLIEYVIVSDQVETNFQTKLINKDEEGWQVIGFAVNGGYHALMMRRKAE